MLAKALAKECSWNFMNVNISSLVDMYLGESQKLGRAVFSLAHKVAPCIIFIDEIDGLFDARKGNTSKHNAIQMMMSEMLSLWDGIGTNVTERVLVLGATNRMEDLDDAVLRRLPL